MRALVQPQRIFVTGATGSIGRAIWPSLAAFQAPLRVLEHQTSIHRLLARQPDLRGSHPPPIEVVRGDLGKPDTLRGATDGCDVVVHAGARTGFASLARAAQRRVNVAGTEALLAQAESAGVRVFVMIGYTGTVQEREDRDGHVNEETLPEGRYESEYVRMKLEAEALTLEANRLGGMTTVVVSPGVFAEPGANSILGGLVKAFVSRELPFRMLNDVWLAPSAGSDVGRCVAAAIERGHGGRRYFVTGDSIRLGEVYELLTELSGVPAPRRKLPDLLVEELGLLAPVLPRHSFLKQLVLPRELVRHLKRLAPVENARTRADLGYAPTPIRAMLSAVIEDVESEARRRAIG